MWRRNLKAGLLLIVALVAVRTWLIEGLIRPQRIAGPSMSNTLHGPHRVVTCRECGWVFPCAETLLHSSGKVICPLCGEPDNDVEQLATASGDRILIDRSAYSWNQPTRWESIVFHCVEKPDQYCIKRVVGLPGEQVELRDGDVYIDGSIARKSLFTAKSMNLIVHDSRYRPQARTAQRGWQSIRELTSAPSESLWQPTATGFSLTKNTTPVSAHQVDWLGYYHRQPAKLPDGESTTIFSQTVSDSYGTNQNISRRLHRVDDLLATAKIQTGNADSLWLQVVRRQNVYQLHLDMISKQVELTRGNQELATVAFDPKSLTNDQLDTHSIDWGTLDGQIVLAIDDNIVLQYAIDDEHLKQQKASLSADAKNTPDSLAARPRLALAVSSTESTPSVDIAYLRVWRDVYYLATPSGHSPALRKPTYQVGPAAYFVLGDNSPISLDSRVLPADSVTADLIVGRPIIWP